MKATALHVSQALTDRSLMSAYAAGDQSAFAEIFRRYGGRVLGRMRRAVGVGPAEDLTQQTFLQLHRARLDFRPEAELEPWLMTIARNVLRDHLRHTARRPAAVSLASDPAGEPLTWTDDERRAVHDAVDQLPMSLGVVVRKHWFEHSSHADIARQLGISRSAVKVRAHRAYRELRRIFGARERVAS